MTQTLQLLNDAISEYDLDEDSDLCEYFGDGDGEDIVADPVNEDEEEEEEEEEDEEEEEVDQKPIIARFANDHCYFMEKKSSNFNRVGNLGIDTPSDSGKSSRFYNAFVFVILIYKGWFEKNTLSHVSVFKYKIKK